MAYGDKRCTVSTMHVLYVIPMQRGQRGTSFTITDRRKSTYDRHADHAVEDEIFTCVCVCVCVGVGGGGGSFTSCAIRLK